MTIRSGVGGLRRERTQGQGGALAPLGSAAAFSWPVVAVYCPIAILIQAPGNRSIYGGSAGLWFLASALGMVALAASLAVARSFTRRLGGPSPLAVLVGYAGAGVCQSVAFGFASVVVGVAESPHLGFRLSGLFLHLPLLTAVGYAVARHDGHRQIRTDLDSARERLLQMGKFVEDELDRVDTQLTAAVRSSLEPAVAALEVALDQAAAGAERAGVLAEIDSLVENRVRPLAHGLATESQADPEVEALDALIDRSGRPRARVPLPEWFRLADAIKPGLVALVTSIGALATAARELSLGEVLVYLPTVSLLAWLVFALTRRLVGSARVRTRLGAPAVAVAYALVGSAAFQLTGAIGVTKPTGIALSWAFGFALLGAAIVAELLVEARRERSEAELRAETVKLGDAVALVRRRERLVRRRLAFVVHGSLQGALHSAAMRIAEAEGLTDVLGEGIRRDLDAALSKLDSGAPVEGSIRTSGVIGELAAVWGGHRSFASRVADSVEDRLRCDTDADEAVAEVVREAVNNAYRHGGARSVEVALDLAGRQLGHPGVPLEIEVSVRDDGGGTAGLVADGPLGLGSALFDDLCRTWALQRDGNATLFRARVALRPVADHGDGIVGAGAGDSRPN